jgi:acyl carrier protein
MGKIKSFEELDKYKLILNKIKEIFSEIMNIPKSDLSIKDDDNFIHLGGLTFQEYDGNTSGGYHKFIEKLEDAFGLSLIDEFWNDEEDFKDLTDDKYATFGGIADYIFSQSNS